MPLTKLQILKKEMKRLHKKYVLAEVQNDKRKMNKYLTLSAILNRRIGKLLDEGE